MRTKALESVLRSKYVPLIEVRPFDQSLEDPLESFQGFEGISKKYRLNNIQWMRFNGYPLDIIQAAWIKPISDCSAPEDLFRTHHSACLIFEGLPTFSIEKFSYNALQCIDMTLFIIKFFALTAIWWIDFRVEKTACFRHFRSLIIWSSPLSGIDLAGWRMRVAATL